MNDKSAYAQIFKNYLNSGLAKRHNKIPRNLSSDPGEVDSLKRLLQNHQIKIKDVEDNEIWEVPLPDIE